MKKPTAEEFYRQRDNRTNMLTDSRDYHQLVVRLVAPSEAAHSYGGQVQLLCASNMLARWCRHVEFGFPDAPLVDRLRMNGFEGLHARIESEVTGADPFGRFVFQDTPSGDAHYTLQLGGGHVLESVDFSVSADNWWARANRGQNTLAQSGAAENPVGAAFAACLGIADAFKFAARLPNNTRVMNTAFSVLNFALVWSDLLQNDFPPPKVVEIGNAQIVGTGSVGSAVVYLMRMLPLKGNITLVDHDTVEISNLNRSPLFSLVDVDQPKVAVAARHLSGVMPVELYHGSYDDFITTRGRRPGGLDLLLPLANDLGVRSTIEHNFPPMQIYGTTTPSWGVNYHRHIPLREDCSVCRFPNDDRGTFVCSTAPIETRPGDRVDAALPFLSMGAAVLTVADLIKLQLRGYPFTSNFAYIDFFGRLEALDSHQKRPRAGCICVGLSPEIHRRYVDTTHFFTKGNPTT